MAHILFLPDDNIVLHIESPLPARELLAMVGAGSWHPPAPYPVLDPGGSIYRAYLIGSIVIISANQPQEITSRGSTEGTPLIISPRMRQVMEDLAEGLSDKEIAIHLNLSSHTIYKLIASLKSRLGARTRADILYRAVALDLVKMKRRKTSDE
jgi:DNA-binding CsgD family transcriptional regulator